MSTTRTSPPPTPHRIMTSPARVIAEPAPAQFIGRPRGINDLHSRTEKMAFSNNADPSSNRRSVLMFGLDTQEEQVPDDENARKQAMRNLVNSWQERLQLISVITTFFATTEAAMLVNTIPNPEINIDWSSGIMQASTASLLGALIVHVYASVLSFLGAFLLISYKLKVARREEMIAEGIPVTNSPLGAPVLRNTVRDIEQGSINRGSQETQTSNNSQPTMTKPIKCGAVASEPMRRWGRLCCMLVPPIFSSVGKGMFQLNASSHRLLSRTHTLCVFLAGVGFVLNVIGILGYSWATQPIAVSIFATACLGGALLTTLVLRI